MSYILDALNKSERERNKGRVPDLKTDHSLREFPSENQGLWRTVVIFLLIAIIVGFSFWLLQGQPSFLQTPGLNTESSSESDTTPHKPSAVTTRQNNQTELSIPSPTVALPVDTSMPSKNIKRFDQVSAGIKSELPTLVFSSHIYSDDPGLRMVNINGRLMKIGEQVNADLSVIDITEEGVVLQYRELLFEKSVLMDWSDG